MIESLCRTTNVNDIQGYITAASTPESQEYGYVFSNCKLISKDCPPNSVYLGRPWRNYAKTVFLECALGNHIHECGFHDWKKEDARNTVLYAEYRNYPASSADTTSNNRSLNDDIHCIDGRCIPYPHRAEYVCELDAVQAEHFPKRMCFPGQITGIHDVLTDGYSSLVPRSSNHRCGELWNSLQIIIVFFSENGNIKLIFHWCVTSNHKCR